MSRRRRATPPTPSISAFAGFRVPPDGGVEGWRFVVSPKDGSQASPPAAASTYEQLCRGQPPAPEGQKRVVVVALLTLS